MNNINALKDKYEFVSFSDKKAAVNGSQRLHLNTGWAAMNLQHLPHHDGNTNQTEPQEEQGAGLGGGNEIARDILWIIEARNISNTYDGC